RTGRCRRLLSPQHSMRAEHNRTRQKASSTDCFCHRVRRYYHQLAIRGQTSKSPKFGMLYAPTMKRTIAIAALSFWLVPVVHAQNKRSPVVALSEPALGERGTTRVLYWNQEKEVAVAAVTVDFGRPVWKKEYDDTVGFDLATKGRVWRLGNDYWTILDSNVPIKIAGRDIPTGLWYLGLHRSDDGSSWSLAFIDPVKARRSRLDPFAMDTVPVDFTVPMTA